MSAIEALPAPDRRRMERVRPGSAIHVTVGRGAGTIVDMSKGGLRVRHTVTVSRGAHVRVAFDWQHDHFDAIAEVLSSRVASLGDGAAAATMFESRLRFVHLSESSATVLDRLMTAITSHELRRWIANLHGWSDEEKNDRTSDSGGSFIRCRLVHRSWEKKWTHDREQPGNGFLLPATVSARELATLCDAYLRADADGRHLIRLMAEEETKLSS